jgi:hypothetical protein
MPKTPTDYSLFMGRTSIAVACLSFLMTGIFEEAAFNEITSSQTNRGAQLRNLADQAAPHAASVGQTSFTPPSLPAGAQAKYDTQYRAGPPPPWFSPSTSLPPLSLAPPGGFLSGLTRAASPSTRSTYSSNSPRHCWVR